MPLASERLGEPGRLRALEEGLRRRLGFLVGLREGVFVPLEEESEEGFDGLGFSRSEEVVFFPSSVFTSFFRSSSFNRSVSVSSDSLYHIVSIRLVV